MLKSRTDLIKEHYGDKFDELKDHIDMQTGYCSAKHTGQINGVKFLLEAQEPTPPLHWKWIPNNGLAKALENNGWKPISEFPIQHYGGYYEFIGADQKIYILYVTEHLKPVLDKQWLMFKPVTLSALPNFYLDE